MNTLLLRPRNGQEPFKARVTEAGRWLDVDKDMALHLETIATVFASEIGYRLPHVHEAAAALMVAWPESKFLKPIVHYPQRDENGLPIVY